MSIGSRINNIEEPEKVSVIVEETFSDIDNLTSKRLYSRMSSLMNNNVTIPQTSSDREKGNNVINEND